MRWKFVINIVGILIFSLGLVMLLPLFCGLLYKDGSVFPILRSMGITIPSGALLYWLFRTPRGNHISAREGMAIVTLGWMAVGLFGALPFHLSDSFPSLVDACFESVSGFTTTGSSILTDIESVPKGLLFWRSLIQWLGGMGIIVLSLAILPFVGVGGMQLYKAEVPSPVPDKLKPRLRETAVILWKVYAVITVLEVILLLFGGMSLFDALCHTFTTMPTGGFSPKNTSIAHYDSLYFDVVIVAFMFIAGINFSLHYQLFKGRPLMFWKDSECRFFVGAVLLLTAVISFDIWGSVYEGLGDAVRYAGFQVVSIVTTTGFATADYEVWPSMSQFLILLCMFMGASAGSTGGGMKCIRLMVCFKYCYRQLYLLIHPRAVTQVKIGGKSVGSDVMESIMGFLALYMGLFAVCTVLLAGMGVDLLTALSAVASCIGNIGPGLGFVGPTENFAAMPEMGKWLLIWCMLLGRLEVYTVLILLVPEFWRK